MGAITAPASLRPEHQTDGFECGELSLDEWLAKRAAKNQASGASHTYVVCEGHYVIAFYSLVHSHSFIVG